MDAAECRRPEHRGVDFFPTSGHPRTGGRPDGPRYDRAGARAAEARAVAVCAACPVREECREHAFRVKMEFGVAGGLTEEERRSRRWRQWWRQQRKMEDGG